jgi:hypothetical protein
MPQAPRTRYALSGDTHIAYQAFGEGDLDLVFVPGKWRLYAAAAQ